MYGVFIGIMISIFYEFVVTQVLKAKFDDVASALYIFIIPATAISVGLWASLGVVIAMTIRKFVNENT